MEDVSYVQREVNTVINPDGSETINVKDTFPDGSVQIRKTTKPACVNKSDIENPSMYYNHEVSEPPAEQAQYNNNAVQTPGALYFLSIAAIVLALAFGSASAAFTGLANDYYNDAYEDDQIIAQSLGGVCILFYILGVPLAFCEARRYPRHGPVAIMVVAWVFYGLGIINAIALLAYSFGEDNETATGWVVFEVVWGVITWGIMFAYMEVSRRK